MKKNISRPPETPHIPEKKSTPVGIKANAEELDLFDWLARKTDRTRSGAIKWAAKKVAIEMGYKPEEDKKHK